MNAHINSIFTELELTLWTLLKWWKLNICLAIVQNIFYLIYFIGIIDP